MLRPPQSGTTASAPAPRMGEKQQQQEEEQQEEAWKKNPNDVIVDFAESVKQQTSWLDLSRGGGGGATRTRTRTRTRTSAPGQRHRMLLENGEKPKENATIHVNVQGEDLTLQLTLLTDLIEDNFQHIYYNLEKEEFEYQHHDPNVKKATQGKSEGSMSKRDLDCFYAVKIVRDTETDTVANSGNKRRSNGGVLSTCDNKVRAHVIREGEDGEDLSFDVEPLDNKGKRHGVFLVKDMEFEPTHCGADELEARNQHQHQHHRHHHQHQHHHHGERLLQDTSTPRTTHLGILLVNDYSFLMRHGNDTMGRSLQVLAEVAAFYDDFPSAKYNIETQISGIVTLTTPWPRDMGIFDLAGRADSGTLLQVFTSWFQSDQVHSMLRNYFDFNVAHLLSGESFRNNVAGVAWLGTFCEQPQFSTGVSADVESITRTAIVYTHEIGHTLGMEHTTTQLPPDVSGTGGQSRSCNRGAWIMNPSTSTAAVSWSSCSTAWFEYFVQGSSTQCMFDPIQPSCGNGIVEEGEDCDCAFGDCSRSLDNVCCDPATCTFKSSKTVCREAQHPTCDVDTMCSGYSSQCPNNSTNLPQAAPCVLTTTIPTTGDSKETINLAGQCFKGECISGDALCVDLLQSSQAQLCPISDPSKRCTQFSCRNQAASSSDAQGCTEMTESFLEDGLLDGLPCGSSSSNNNNNNSDGDGNENDNEPKVCYKSECVNYSRFGPVHNAPIGDTMVPTISPTLSPVQLTTDTPTETPTEHRSPSNKTISPTISPSQAPSQSNDAFPGACELATDEYHCELLKRGFGCPVKWMGQGCRRSECAAATDSSLPMLWGLECRGSRAFESDGGCRFEEYCGFTCREECERQSHCIWDVANSTCRQLAS